MWNHIFCFVKSPFYIRKRFRSTNANSHRYTIVFLENFYHLYELLSYVSLIRCYRKTSSEKLYRDTAVYTVWRLTWLINYGKFLRTNFTGIRIFTYVNSHMHYYIVFLRNHQQTNVTEIQFSPPVWILIWLVKWLFCEIVFKQTLQEYGLSPV